MDSRLTLEKRIEAELKSYDGIMGIYADDLHGNVTALHADEPFETASTIKVFILACLFEQIEKRAIGLEDQLNYEDCHYTDGSGLLKALDAGLTLRVKDAATLMIIVSDNIATNIIIDLLGIDRINDCIRRLGCEHTELYNSIHFDRYRKLGTTTPREYAGMFTRLAKGELIGREADEKMIAILKKQHYNSMMTREFPPFFTDGDSTSDVMVEIASKSGSMNACRNDGGIVFTPYGAYVLVMLNKEFSDAMYYQGHPATAYGAKVSKLVLDQYLALEGRFVLPEIPV